MVCLFNKPDIRHFNLTKFQFLEMVGDSVVELLAKVFTSEFLKNLFQFSSVAIATGIALEIGLSLLGNSLYKMFNFIERS